MRVASLGRAIAATTKATVGAAGVAIGAAGVSVGAAAVAVAVAALELAGISHPHIWSNAWAVGGVVIGGIGLMIAVAVVVMGPFRFMAELRRQAAAGRDDGVPEPPSTQTVGTTVTSQRDLLNPDQVRVSKEIRAGFSEIINEIVGMPTDKVTPHMNFVADLGLDSLSMVEIAVAVEDKFGVKISDKQLETLQTVQDVVNFVSKNS